MSEDTIAAISTPLGEGGIGVIRISGPEALSIALKVFCPFRRSQGFRPEPWRVYWGRVVDPSTGEVLDQVLFTYFRAPRSYTGEDVVEISAHGGPVVLRRILRTLLRLGSRLAEPGEFTKRAFLNGRMDLSQAEAVIDTIKARTEASATVAVRQLEGRLAERLKPAREQLLNLLSLLEATIDFPEEVEEPSRQEVKTLLEEVLQTVHHLLASAEAGRVYREGIAVVIAGKPNVGKSSLLNALLRESRAIVTDIPGTTRDLLEEGMNLRGIPLRVIDTAGMREAQDLVERIGVERARDSIQSADLVLWVVDRSSPLTSEDRKVAEVIEGRRTILVINKIDQPPAWCLSDLSEAIPLASSLPKVEVSVTKGVGLSALEDLIVETVCEGAIEPSQVYVSNLRHINALEKAKEALLTALEANRQQVPLDLLSGEIRSAAEHLALITGESVTEEVIESIFSRFCVGK